MSKSAVHNNLPNAVLCWHCSLNKCRCGSTCKHRIKSAQNATFCLRASPAYVMRHVFGLCHRGTVIGTSQSTCLLTRESNPGSASLAIQLPLAHWTQHFLTCPSQQNTGRISLGLQPPSWRFHLSILSFSLLEPLLCIQSIAQTTLQHPRKSAVSSAFRHN